MNRFKPLSLLLTILASFAVISGTSCQGDFGTGTSDTRSVEIASDSAGSTLLDELRNLKKKDSYLKVEMKVAPSKIGNKLKPESTKTLHSSQAEVIYCYLDEKRVERCLNPFIDDETGKPYSVELNQAVTDEFASFAVNAYKKKDSARMGMYLTGLSIGLAIWIGSPAIFKSNQFKKMVTEYVEATAKKSFMSESLEYNRQYQSLFRDIPNNLEKYSPESIARLMKRSLYRLKGSHRKNMLELASVYDLYSYRRIYPNGSLGTVSDAEISLAAFKIDSDNPVEVLKFFDRLRTTSTAELANSLNLKKKKPEYTINLALKLEKLQTKVNSLPDELFDISRRQDVAEDLAFLQSSARIRDWDIHPTTLNSDFIAKHGLGFERFKHLTELNFATYFIGLEFILLSSSASKLVTNRLSIIDIDKTIKAMGLDGVENEIDFLEYANNQMDDVSFSDEFLAIKEKQ